MGICTYVLAAPAISLAAGGGGYTGGGGGGYAGGGGYTGDGGGFNQWLKTSGDSVGVCNTSCPFLPPFYVAFRGS